jgi:hypothetical protein
MERVFLGFGRLRHLDAGFFERGRHFLEADRARQPYLLDLIEVELGRDIAAFLLEFGQALVRQEAMQLAQCLGVVFGVHDHAPLGDGGGIFVRKGVVRRGGPYETFGKYGFGQHSVLPRDTGGLSHHGRRVDWKSTRFYWPLPIPDAARRRFPRIGHCLKFGQPRAGSGRRFARSPPRPEKNLQKPVNFS